MSGIGFRANGDEVYAAAAADQCAASGDTCEALDGAFQRGRPSFALAAPARWVACE
jgi:hypothetical protein